MPISKAKNTAIKSLQLPNRSLLIAINRIDQVILPKGDIRIAEDDEIIAFVHDQDKDAITNLFQNKTAHAVFYDYFFVYGIPWLGSLIGRSAIRYPPGMTVVSDPLGIMVIS